MIRRLEFFEIVVSDLDAAVVWYSQNLGFVLSGEIVSNEDGRWCQLATPEGDNHLALWQPSWMPAPEGKIHPSFIPVFAVCNLRAFVDRLIANNVVMIEGIRERMGYCITTIADLEGNKLQLFEATA